MSVTKGTRLKIQKHFVIPDAQVKPNTNTDHLEWAANYIVEKKPDVIICLGDFADMESLSSYDIGKKSFEGRRYTEDVKAAKDAMDRFLAPIRKESQRRITQKMKSWKPKLVLTLGNHENRINKTIESDAKLHGLLSCSDLGYEERGWEVIPFLKVHVIDGVAYSHYFVSGVMGRPVGSARMLLTKHHMSCIAGHQQGRDIAYGKSADGKSMTGIISGSFYSHDEDYLTAQNNIHWRGCWMLNEVREGQFDELPISIDYLKRRYSK